MELENIQTFINELTHKNRQELKETVAKLANELDFSNDGYVELHPKSFDEREVVDKHLTFLRKLGVVRDFGPTIKSNYPDDKLVAYKVALRELMVKQLQSLLSDSDAPTETPPIKNGGVAELHFSQKKLRLTYGGVTCDVKKYASTKNYAHAIIDTLIKNPDFWQDKKSIRGISSMDSKLKDWPKLIGLGGKLKDVFLSVDTKNQRIKLHNKKSLTPDEAEIVNAYVKSKQVKK